MPNGTGTRGTGFGTYSHPMGHVGWFFLENRIVGTFFFKPNPPRYLHIVTWNPNDPSFGSKRPCFLGLTFKNRGHLGSIYIYI